MFGLAKAPSVRTDTFIIAEIGINHNGNIDKAKRLIDAAAACGASAAKLQTYITENRVKRAQRYLTFLSSVKSVLKNKACFLNMEKMLG